jgi:DNA-binding PadR family transcriptional regulator
MARATKNDAMELVVLAVLGDGPLYGYAITKKVAARSAGEMKVSPGVLYPLLSLLEKQGLITSTWEEVRAERSEAEAANAGEPAAPRGRRRKWYKLSPKGKKRLEQRIDAHRSYQRMLESFLGGGGTARGEGARA